MLSRTEEKDQLGRSISPGNHDAQARELTYVLVTPARNEEAFIEQTIKSVIAQTRLPSKWIIVSDGSTDGTDDIVRKYCAEYPWIELLQMPQRTERHFAGKGHAFNAGFQRIKETGFDVIGNLDADITFEPDYFAYLVNKFAENSRLGVGGTPFREGVSEYDYRFTSIEHVSGACQLFRRECFESIGGYKPIEEGGIDLVAVLTARMHGWQTRSFPEKHCTHLRSMGTASASPLKSHFLEGRKDYAFGGHPLWEAFRTVYQMTKKPYLVRGCALFCGYAWSMVRNTERPVSDDLVRFRRKEQMQRLRAFLIRSLTPSSHQRLKNERP